MFNMDYIVLSQQFCETHQNYSKNGLKFGYGITTAGEYVCAENTIKEFPELFQYDTILPRVETKRLRLTDFTRPVFVDNIKNR